MKPTLKTLAVLLAVVARAQFAYCGQAVYDNSTTDTQYNLGLTNNQVVGGEVFMDSSQLAVSPYLTNFSFEYYSPNTSWSGTVQADIKFYLNDGTPYHGYGSPGTLFYDSGLFAISTPLSINSGGNGVATLTFSWMDLYLPYNPITQDGALMNMNLNAALPQDFTVVYSFSGLAGGDQIGLEVFNPPTVGTNYGDYWIMNGSSWELVTNNAGGVAVGSQFINSPEPAPEPSVLGLGAMGMVLMAQLIRRRK